MAAAAAAVALAGRCRYRCRRLGLRQLWSLPLAPPGQAPLPLQPPGQALIPSDQTRLPWLPLLPTYAHSLRYHLRTQSPLSAACGCRGFFSFGDQDDNKNLSKHYEESRLIGYSPEQLFAVVADVDLYEDFVPWCQRSTVLWRKNDEAMEAELEIGFRFFVERYISHVTMKHPNLIKTTASQSTIFEHLINIWEFKPGPTPNSCNLHFLVDFQFRSPLYRKVVDLFFNEVVAKLVSSFENRCKQVYGPSVDVMSKARPRR